MGKTHDNWEVEGDLLVTGKITDEAGGAPTFDEIILLDRVTGTTKKMYSSNGSVLTEAA